MESVCQNYSTNNDNKKFINEELIRNRIKFFTEFLDEDEMCRYILKGIGHDLILDREQLTNLIHNGKVIFEIVTDECAIGVLNNIPVIIEYL